jgi:hypothetical protein
MRATAAGDRHVTSIALSTSAFVPVMGSTRRFPQIVVPL